MKKTNFTQQTCSRWKCYSFGGVKGGLLLLLCYLLSSTRLYAQHPYIPIPADSALWVTVNENWHEGEPPPATHTFTYSLGWTDATDTIVNGKNYLCYFGEFPNTAISHPLPEYPAKFGIWIRQDTIAKKIWLIRDKSTPNDEECLYDFSLQTGDTITDPLNSYFNSYRLAGAKVWVDHIDSVYWADNRWRYRWWLNSNYNTGFGLPGASAVQIESMGYTTNFFDDPFLRYHPLIGYTLQLTCFRLKKQWLYEQPNPWHADCDSLIDHNVALGIDEVAVNEMEQPMLYPNPAGADGMLYINNLAGKANQAYQLEGYDIGGKRVISTRVKPGDAITLSHYLLTRGFYLFRFTTTDHVLLHTQKIIIQ